MGAKLYYLANFFSGKLHENEGNWTGARIRPGSTNGIGEGRGSLSIGSLFEPGSNDLTSND